MLKRYTTVMVSDEIRRLITHEKVRPDGRKVDEIRPLLIVKLTLLPRTHGSALFTRADKHKSYQLWRLGPKSDEQIIDNLTDEESRRLYAPLITSRLIALAKLND